MDYKPSSKVVLKEITDASSVGVERAMDPLPVGGSSYGLPMMMQLGGPVIFPRQQGQTSRQVAEAQRLSNNPHTVIQGAEHQAPMQDEQGPMVQEDHQVQEEPLEQVQQDQQEPLVQAEPLAQPELFGQPDAPVEPVAPPPLHRSQRDRKFPEKLQEEEESLVIYSRRIGATN
ncbi:hypothetical protein BVC80_8301g9 [Macleaya cordata]|uniref:Uncharacterized protein n=1 Tax=Macleaya cordata TaxID=56857 RepID=A0A200QRQ9_MACCD|nr:hypothetical protein BVC80_8301g9 [Macleaya cordata]